jgi:hypothetical protein
MRCCLSRRSPQSTTAPAKDPEVLAIIRKRLVRKLIEGSWHAAYPATSVARLKRSAASLVQLVSARTYTRVIREPYFSSSMHERHTMQVEGLAGLTFHLFMATAAPNFKPHQRPVPCRDSRRHESINQSQFPMATVGLHKTNHSCDAQLASRLLAARLLRSSSASHCGRVRIAFYMQLSLEYPVV